MAWNLPNKLGWLASLGCACPHLVPTSLVLDDKCALPGNPAVFIWVLMIEVLLAMHALSVTYCMCVGAVPEHTCRGQRSICRSGFSISSVQVPGIELKVVKLGSKYLYLLSHLTNPEE